MAAWRSIVRHLMTDRRPYAVQATSNWSYTKAGDGERLAMLVLHDDTEREYAYCLALRPETKVGALNPFSRQRQ